jgi:vacuolar-type H+-ATPase subunit F/Vma7
MARVAVLGEQVRVQGFALAGALVLEAGDAAQVRAAWASLPGDVAVVVLTPRAARALQDHPPPGAGLPLTVVLPP